MSGITILFLFSIAVVLWSKTLVFILFCSSLLWSFIAFKFAGFLSFLLKDVDTTLRSKQYSSQIYLAPTAFWNTFFGSTVFFCWISHNIFMVFISVLRNWILLEMHFVKRSSISCGINIFVLFSKLMSQKQEIVFFSCV